MDEAAFFLVFGIMLLTSGIVGFAFFQSGKRAGELRCFQRLTPYFLSMLRDHMAIHAALRVQGVPMKDLECSVDDLKKALPELERFFSGRDSLSQSLGYLPDAKKE
jgi:hypothetical protein